MLRKSLRKLLILISINLTVLALTSCGNTVMTNPSDSPGTGSIVTAVQTQSITPHTDSSYSKKGINSWEEYEASACPLIASVPDKDIYLYDTKKDQIILKVGENEYYYSWHCLTPRFILPRMGVNDFDNDGKDELLVIVYVGSGTGVSVEDLHVIELSEEATSNPNQLKDYVFNPEDYVSKLKTAVSFKSSLKSGKLLGEMAFENKKASINLEKYQAKDYGKLRDNII